MASEQVPTGHCLIQTLVKLYAAENRGDVVKTTVFDTGLGTSFEMDGVTYLISTIYRPDLGGYFQTMILRYPERTVVYRIEVRTQYDAVTEHLDAVEMVTTKTLVSWDKTKPYQDDVMEEKVKGTGFSIVQEIPWTAQEIRERISKANIGYID